MLVDRDEMIIGLYDKLKKQAGFPAKQVKAKICEQFNISENTLKQILYNK